MDKITIIGSSIAGASSAYYLSKNFDILLVEEHDHFRKTCSGIVTNVIDGIIKLPNELIINKISLIRINAPNKGNIEIKLKKPDYVFDREKLNKFFTDKAVDKGAELLQPAKFKSITNNRVEIKHNNEIKYIETDHLIGADGANSTVSKAAGFNNKINYFLGIKSYLKMEHDDAIDVFPDIGLFSWIVPHQDNIVEVGTFCYLHQARLFDVFLKHINLNKNLKIAKEAALIPIYNPKVSISKEVGNIQVKLIGDAASMVKATTGGSIFQSISAAKILSESLSKNKDYPTELKKHLGNDLWTHLKIRGILDKFNEDDWNDLIERFKKKGLIDILQKESRDFPFKMVIKLLLKDPGLLFYSKFLF